MPQSFASLPCHVIFSTQHRQPWIAEDLAPRLYAYIGGILRDEQMSLLAAGGVPDHVHLLVSLSRVHSVADVVRLIKSNSSAWLHKTFPELASFAWQAGYGAFGVSQSNVPVVKRYIATQQEHHRQRTFQDEFRDFLRSTIWNGTSDMFGIEGVRFSGVVSREQRGERVQPRRLNAFSPEGATANSQGREPLERGD